MPLSLRSVMCGASGRGDLAGRCRRDVAAGVHIRLGLRAGGFVCRFRMGKVSFGVSAAVCRRGRLACGFGVFSILFMFLGLVFGLFGWGWGAVCGVSGLLFWAVSVASPSLLRSWDGLGCPCGRSLLLFAGFVRA